MGLEDKTIMDLDPKAGAYVPQVFAIGAYVIVIGVFL